MLHKPEWSDINIVTGCLKLYFRELEQPLIAPQHYPVLVDTLSKPHPPTLLARTHAAVAAELLSLSWLPFVAVVAFRCRGYY